MSIRDYIINNFKEDDINGFKSAIEESIKEEDEETLPGMGVFMEILWSNADDELKDKILNIIKDNISK